MFMGYMFMGYIFMGYMTHSWWVIEWRIPFLLWYIYNRVKVTFWITVPYCSKFQISSILIGQPIMWRFGALSHFWILIFGILKIFFFNKCQNLKMGISGLITHRTMWISLDIRGLRLFTMDQSELISFWYRLRQALHCSNGLHATRNFLKYA